MKDKLSQFFTQSRQRMARFMAGRNGNDNFNLFLLVCEVVLLLLGSLTGGGMFLPALFLLGYIYFRMLSRNVYKRQEENSRYLRAKYKVQSKLRLVKERWKQRRDYKFFRCPGCRNRLRLPRGKGRIQITCPRCGHRFGGKT